MEKDMQLFIAFMNLEMAYIRYDRQSFLNVLKIYGGGRYLLQEIRSVYKDVCYCMQEQS